MEEQATRGLDGVTGKPFEGSYDDHRPSPGSGKKMRHNAEKTFKDRAARLCRKVGYDKVEGAAAEVPESEAAIELRVFHAVGPRVLPSKSHGQGVAVLKHQMGAGGGPGNCDADHPHPATDIQHGAEARQVEPLGNAFEEQPTPRVHVVAAEKPVREMKDRLAAEVLQGHGLVDVVERELCLGRSHVASVYKRPTCVDNHLLFLYVFVEKESAQTLFFVLGGFAGPSLRTGPAHKAREGADSLYAESLEKAVREVVEPLLEGLGYSLVELTIGRLSGSTRVNVVIYRQQGVGVDRMRRDFRHAFPPAGNHRRPG